MIDEKIKKMFVKLILEKTVAPKCTVDVVGDKFNVIPIEEEVLV